MRRFLYPQHANRVDKPSLRIFYKPTLCFRPPHNLSTPLIMIGPGTGVAPFISFLAHRYAQELDRRKQSNSGDCCGEGLWRGGFELEDLPSERGAVDKYIDSCVPGDVVLFFGCRNEDDFLFKQELALYEREHTLTRLYVAMSRQSDKKVYVMHKIAEQSAYLCDLIVQQHAQVYICGDGNKMAKDVIAALKDVLMQGGMEKEGAEGYVTDMQQRKRLLLDIWSP
ncbi:hypothetical protein EON65_53535 [archaeon]|nr:MAG: hypothetical protein EON65_53535 [archaeon]